MISSVSSNRSNAPQRVQRNNQNISASKVNFGAKIPKPEVGIAAILLSVIGAVSAVKYIDDTPRREVQGRIPFFEYSKLQMGEHLVAKHNPQFLVKKYWEDVRDSIDGVKDSVTGKVISPSQKYGTQRMIDADTFLKKFYKNR